MGLKQVGSQAMADRYAYLPFIGLFIMVCWGCADWAEERTLATAWLAAPGIAVLLALTVVAHRQIDYWGDNVTLWSHTLQVTSGNWQAENNLGMALFRQGRMEEAIPHFRAAAAIDPSIAVSNHEYRYLRAIPREFATGHRVVQENHTHWREIPS